MTQGRLDFSLVISSYKFHLKYGIRALGQAWGNMKKIADRFVLIIIFGFVTMTVAITGKNAIALTGSDVFTLPTLPDFFAPTALARVVSQSSDDYRIGDVWGKKPVTEDVFNRETAAFKRAAQATASAGGGTSFFLGEFNGQMVMATNHHVFPDQRACLRAHIHFPLLDVDVSCEKYFGTWTDIDLTLYSVEVEGPLDREKLLSVAGNFAFRKDLLEEQGLLTIGFGIAGNPGRQLMAGQDSDCKVFSKKNEFRFMGDPDEFNPGPYKAWSFSNGCDVSHGDSGSAMVDRQTSEVVGIIWTGRVPKNPKVQHSDYLRDVLTHQTEEVWTELSYAVPAQKIGQLLQGLIDQGTLEPETQATFQALLGD